MQGSINTSNIQAKLTEHDNNVLCLMAQQDKPLVFGKLLGRELVTISVNTCATPKNGIAIALVLDNTGSMASSEGGVAKIDALKEAATELVETINPDQDNPNAAIAIVPFAATVNVDTSHAKSDWMDRSGLSSIHWENFTTANKWKPESRFDVFSRMGTAWAGCGEERPAPYTTTDTPASMGKPDTLYIPSLAPDEAGQALGVVDYPFSPSASYPAQKYSSYYWSFNSYLSDTGGSCSASDISAKEYANDVISRGSGAKKLCKYDGQKVAKVDSGLSGVNGGTGRFPAGPNLVCTTQPLQSLTTDMNAVSGKSGLISKMTPNGDTNLVVGIMWGWRTISPNGPFAETGSPSGKGLRKPAGYDSMTTKVIVLMTDGFSHWASNPYSPYKSTYSAFRYMANNRLASFGANFKGNDQSGATNARNYRAQVDAAFISACTNAKAAGIVVYTIALSTKTDLIDSQGEDALRKCASGDSIFYNASNKDSLKSAFAEIAKRGSKMRLSL